MSRAIVLTNNTEVMAAYPEADFIHGSATDVLTRARDLVHIGHCLLSHPLMGSVKPNHSPYKTVVLRASPSALDLPSLSVIEGALATFRRFLADQALPDWDEVTLADFRLIDFELAKNTLADLCQGCF